VIREKTDILFEPVYCSSIGFQFSFVAESEHLCDTPNPDEKHCALRLSCSICLTIRHTYSVSISCLKTLSFNFNYLRSCCVVVELFTRM
jgi:hypothetical protein